MRLFFLSVFFILLFFSCDYSVDKHYPPENVVARVTDTHLLSDGNYLLILNSDYNRAYDFGRLSVVKLGQSGKPTETVSSLLIEALGGKMVVSSDEKEVFVSTREFGAVHKILISRDKNNVPHLSYAVNDSLRDSSVDVSAEPYAMTFTANGEGLLVTHLMNGELTLIDPEKMEVLNTFKLHHGISGIAYDKYSDVYLVTYRDFSELHAVRLSGTITTPDLDIFRLIPDLPYRGTDFRDIIPSEQFPGSFYVSYRNKDGYGEAWPLVFRLTVENDSVRVSGSVDWMTPVAGSLAEMAKVVDTDNSNEWLFVAATKDRLIYVLDGTSGDVLWRMDLDDCEPYQLHSSDADGRWKLFVSCFTDDKIMVYDVDPSSDATFSLLEVIK